MNELKYKIKDGQIVKRDGEKPIPVNEPLFIFRAKDRKSLIALMAYNMVLDNLDQKAAVTKCIEVFRAWQELNPEKVEEPRP